MSSKTLIFIPTYNERDNVEKIYHEIKKQKLNADLLFLDDHSPDGTGDLIDAFSKKDAGVYTIHRAGKLGIGSAHQDGIAWAYDRGYTTLVTMDCDFTHLPEDIQRFLEWSDRYAVVIGSRYMDKKSIADWNPFRKFLTHLGHFLTKTLLRMPYDASGAFRLYRLDQIPRSLFGLVRSKSYSFFFESLYALSLNNFSIKEITIRLHKRTYGNSKMRVSDALKSFELLLCIWWRTLVNRKSFACGKPRAVERNDEGDWNEYWKKKDKKSKIIYDWIASFYRVAIIRPMLDRAIKKNFKQGSDVLHGGCGGGEVDHGTHSYLRLTAMDISEIALNRYKALHPQAHRLVHGDLFKIPLPDASFEGIYNLGVMEHFAEEEIEQMLAEFKRVLKPRGKAVLFWPPSFGLSVKFLGAVHFILNDVLKKNIKLHPDEITHIRSKEHARKILEKSGFAMKEYSFGIHDLFTYVTLVGEPAAGGKENERNV